MFPPQSTIQDYERGQTDDEHATDSRGGTALTPFA